MYKKYEKVLLEECGIDFNRYITVLANNGNTTGVYADVALLLYRLVRFSGTNSVLEFGSGMSTLILSKACMDYGKNLVVGESGRKWYNITKVCLDALSLNSRGFVCTDSDESKFPVLDGPVSLVWVDGTVSEVQGPGYNRLGSCEYYWNSIKGACLLFDDSESAYMSGIKPVLEQNGRSDDSYFLFNPTGRGDRQVLVSVPESGEQFLDVVKSCIL